MKSQLNPSSRRCRVASVALLAGLAGPASAFEIDLGETTLKIDNLVSIGAVMRMQDRDDSLIGKSSLQPGLCVGRSTPGDFDDPNRRYAGDTCSGTVEDAEFGNRNNFYLTQPGSLTPTATTAT